MCSFSHSVPRFLRASLVVWRLSLPDLSSSLRSGRSPAHAWCWYPGHISSTVLDLVNGGFISALRRLLVCAARCRRDLDRICLSASRFWVSHYGRSHREVRSAMAGRDGCWRRRIRLQRLFLDALEECLRGRWQSACLATLCAGRQSPFSEWGRDRRPRSVRCREGPILTPCHSSTHAIAAIGFASVVVRLMPGIYIFEWRAAVQIAGALTDDSGSAE